MGASKHCCLTLRSLLLWNVATADEPTWDPPLIEVGLNSMELEAPPSTRAEDPLSPKGTDSAICDPMATSSQASPCVVMLENIPSIIQVSHSPSPLPCWEVWRWPASPLSTVSDFLQGQSNQPDRWGALTAREMNTALKQLFMTKATMDSCQREAALNVNIPRCKMKPRLPRPSERQKSAMQPWSRRWMPTGWSMPVPWKSPTRKACLQLEHEAIAGGRMGLSSIPRGLWTCPPKACGVLMHPLKLLTGNLLLATILGMLATTQQPATAGREATSSASHLQCQGCQHPQPELNGSTACLTGKQPCQDQRKRKLGD